MSEVHSVSALMVRSRLAAIAIESACGPRDAIKTLSKSGRRSRAQKFLYLLARKPNTLFRTHQPNSLQSITHSLSHGSTKIVAPAISFPGLGGPIPPAPFTIPFGPPFIGVLYAADTRECLGGSSAYGRFGGP